MDEGYDNTAPAMPNGSEMYEDVVSQELLGRDRVCGQVDSEKTWDSEPGAGVYEASARRE
jgi:hypothetical protein